MEISKEWKFQKGDNAEWSAVEFDDSEWGNIEAGKLWERQMEGDYDGIAWYRKKVLIPSSMKDQLSDNYKSINVALGKIDDADEVYFNGEKIGQSGSADKDGLTAYDQQRRYTVDASKVKWDEENLIAVKVYDHGGGGGLYRGPYAIYPTTWLDYVSMETVVDGFEGVIAKDEALHTQGNFENISKSTIIGKATCIIKTDIYEEVDRFEQKINVPAGETYSMKYTFKPKIPGFYQVVYEYQIGDLLLSDSTFFGYDPANLTSELPRPDDFDEYWAKARAELNAVAPEFKMTLDKEKSNDLLNVYEVEMKSLGNVTIRGWYSVPKNNNGNLPALLKNVGYSGNMQPVYDRPDFAVFGLNIRGHGNSRDDVNPGFPQYITTNIDDKEKYIYRGAYMDCVRAIDFLCSRSEVDTSRIGVYGGSQGGALTFATAALDKRIKLCAPHIPYLSAFRRYYDIIPPLGKKFEDYLDKHPNMTWEKMYATLDYIDIGNLAPWIKVPVFMGVGLADRRCPPYINFAAFNRISSKDKQWFVYQGYGHSVPDRHHKAEYEWLKTRFGVEN